MTEVAGDGSDSSWSLLVLVLSAILVGGVCLAVFFGVVLSSPPPVSSDQGKREDRAFREPLQPKLLDDERPVPRTFSDGEEPPHSVVVEVEPVAVAEAEEVARDPTEDLPLQAVLPPDSARTKQTGEQESREGESEEKVQSSSPVDTEPEPSSLTIEFTMTVAENVQWIGIVPIALPPQPLIIGQVQTGSWGAQNNILEGDVLTSINGKSSQDMTITDLDDVMRERPLELHFRRKVSPGDPSGWSNQSVEERSPQDSIQHV